MSLVWYDLETFGLHARYDRIAQFAALRTDENLNLIDEPVVLYGKLSPDYLPDPMACLVSGISPQEANEKGLNEVELIRRIDSWFSRPGTCVLGYNNIAFDDEFIRSLYYRNFYDPYRREWANGNSRWDILTLTRACRDMRPDGINWPLNEEGKPTVQLESLAKANNIAQSRAHDALSDTEATLAIARLIREKQPKFYEWAWKHRTKDKARTLIDLEGRTPLLHTSALHYSSHGYTALVCPLVADPNNRNSIYAFDLRTNPEPLLSLPEEEIRKRIFTPTDELDAQGIQRIPLREIAINKAPFLAPRAALTSEAAQRIGIDIKQAEEHWRQLQNNGKLIGKLRRVLSKSPDWGTINDPDFQLYDRFFPDEDKAILDTIRNAPPQELIHLNPHAKDTRIPEMLRRCIGRNYPEHLSDEARQRWRSFCASRILFPPIPKLPDLNQYRKRIRAWMENSKLEASKKPILKALMEYGDYLEKELLS